MKTPLQHIGGATLAGLIATTLFLLLTLAFPGCI